MTTKKKILVVDDEVNLTKMVKRNLEITGKFDVMTENQGSQALAALLAPELARILTDDSALSER